MFKTLNRQGLTLVEIILAMAILGIIMVALLPAFTAGIKGIANAGSISKTSYFSQDQSEAKLVQGAATTADEITVNFTGADPVVVQGEKAVNGAVVLFIPK